MAKGAIVNNSRYPAAVRLLDTNSMDRQQWEVARMGGLGGSDIAPILGLSKWGTALGTWRGKVWPEERERVETASTEWGTRLEPVIRDAFKSKHPDFTVEQVHAILASKEANWARANVDGLVREPSGAWGILEIKTANAYSGAPDWVDGPPAYYQTQVDWYCLVTGLRFIWVVVLIGGQDYREYRFDADEARLELLAAKVSEFWDRVDGARQDVAAGVERQQVVAKWAPPAKAQDIGALADLYPMAEKVEPVDLSEDFDEATKLECYAMVRELDKLKDQRGQLHNDLQPIKAAIEEVEAVMEDYRARIQQLANGAQAAFFGTRQLYGAKLKKGRVSFKPTKLKEAYPEIYAELSDKAADSWETAWNI